MAGAVLAAALADSQAAPMNVFAAVDLGSNSFHMIVASEQEDHLTCHRPAARARAASPQFSSRGEMIAQRFDFTTHFLKERNTGRISEKKKMRCGIKDQARAR
ncbi:MAG: hypothetical protein ACR2RB_20095, partial [Gammaproteobacteria bacterium]